MKLPLNSNNKHKEKMAILNKYGVAVEIVLPHQDALAILWNEVKAMRKEYLMARISEEAYAATLLLARRATKRYQDTLLLQS